MLGWWIAHIGRPDRATRLWCLIAAVIADLDSLGLLFGREAYERYHHVLFHNLTFGVLVALLSVYWLGWRLWAVVAVFAAFVSHLVGDYFASGAGWGISPFLPFSRVEYVYTMVPRDVLVPNIIGTVGTAVVAVLIAARTGRTPLEFVHVDAERLVVNAIRLRAQRTLCATCGARASFRCARCETPVCSRHVEPSPKLRPRCAACVP